MARNSKADAELTKQRLLDIAQHLFATRGVSSTSLDDIAVQARVTRGAVYWHFLNKQHLLDELYQRSRPRVDLIFSQLQDEARADPISALWRYAHRVLDSVAKDEQMRCMATILMLRDEGENGDADMTRRDRSRQLATMQAFSTVLKMAADRGDLLPQPDIPSMTLLYQCTLRGILWMLLTQPSQFNRNRTPSDTMLPMFRGLVTNEAWQRLLLERRRQR